MNAQDLKNSILQLAIQGRLVEQRDEENTGEELYQQIQEEKQQLIEEGKIRKRKKLPEITEEEILFEIPSTWKWVRYGNVINVVSAKRVHKSDWKSSGIPFYRAREIAKLAQFDKVDNDLFITQELYDEFTELNKPEPGDLMVTAVGTLGKTYIVKENDLFYYKDASVICLENIGNISSEFVKLLMESKFMETQIKNNSSGTTVSTLTISRMNAYFFPLPPLEEQKRIVAKIEELIPFVERHGDAYEEVTDLNKEFPLEMEKSILQYAIQGKLVEQNEEEGTAEEFYHQIQEEKQRLIDEGTIKKQKKLSEITEEEIPFDIPGAWKWVKLGDVINLLSGQDMPSNMYNDEMMGIPYITGASNIEDSQINVNRWIEQPRSVAEKGQLLLTCKGTIGKTAILDIEQAHIARQIMSINPLKNDVEYIKVYINSYVNELKRQAKSMIPGINRSVILDAPFPMPPLKEQKRIVAKIEELQDYTKRLVKED